MHSIHQNNEEILSRLSTYLNICPNAIAPQDVADLAASCDFSSAEAYLQAIRPVQAASGGIVLTQEHYAPMELFIRDDLHTDSRGRVLPQLE